MREIKVRYLNKEHTKWIEIIIPTYFDNKYNTLPIELDYETQGQFTGIKDKNGKEIYEGDIVDYGLRGIIVIEEPQSDGGMSDEYIHGWVLGSRDIEPERDGLVIGNIYENSDLLK